MKSKVNLVIVNKDYCDFLRKYDSRVYSSFDKKVNRPYIGVLFKIDDMEYFAPLSSPKRKHLHMINTIDFHKIINKKQNNDNQLIGVINFNNMIPLTSKNYELINLNAKSESKIENKYLNLLRLDFIFINNNYDSLVRKAEKLYYLYKNDLLSIKIKNRCCDFNLLEEKCQEYNKNKKVAI